jgi:hypothetical protein
VCFLRKNPGNTTVVALVAQRVYPRTIPCSSDPQFELEKIEAPKPPPDCALFGVADKEEWGVQVESVLTVLGPAPDVTDRPGEVIRGTD